MKRPIVMAMLVLGAISTSSRADSILKNWNVVALGNFGSNSDVEGRALIGGDLVDGATFANALNPASQVGVTTLAVGGNVTDNSAFQLLAGNAAIGGSLKGGLAANGPGATISTNDPGVSSLIAQAAAELSSTSSTLAALSSNSTVVLSPNNPGQPGPLVFTALPELMDGQLVAVFDVNASYFSNNQVQQIELVNNFGAASFIINVHGATMNFTQGNFVGLFNTAPIRARTLWNFVDATSVATTKNWAGSILAPLANVTIGGGNIDGSIYAGGNVMASSEIHLPTYQGFTPSGTPVVPEPSTIAMSGLGALGVLGCVLRRRRKIG